MGKLGEPEVEMRLSSTQILQRRTDPSEVVHRTKAEQIHQRQLTRSGGVERCLGRLVVADD
jgi:hypothetical protein